MSTTVLGRTGYGTFSKSKEKTALADRLKKYFAENSAIILSGMMTLNGNPQAFKTYLMLKNDAVR